jgi:hypothetical protein
VANISPFCRAVFGQRGRLLINYPVQPRSDGTFREKHRRPSLTYPAEARSGGVFCPGPPRISMPAPAILYICSRAESVAQESP